MKQVHKIGPVELLKEDVMRLYAEKKYIVTYSKIFQIMPPSKRTPLYHGHLIYTQNGGGLTMRGRFHALTGKEVNSLIGYNLLND